MEQRALKSLMPTMEIDLGLVLSFSTFRCVRFSCSVVLLQILADLFYKDAIYIVYAVLAEPEL